MSTARLCLTKDDVKKAGLNFWASGVVDGKDPEVDIVLVQGLGSDPYHTWVGRYPHVKNGEKRSWAAAFTWSHRNNGQTDEKTLHADCFWPKDLLPDHFPNARIATYSYRSNWLSKEDPTTLRECGEQFLSVLHQHRHGETSRHRPIVLVGHSLGALVIQQALVIADHGDEFANIRDSTAAAIFLGAPGRGSSGATLADWASWACKNNQPLLSTLGNDSQELFYLFRDFWAGHGPLLPITCFYERRESQYGPLKLLTVPQQSSTMTGKRMIYLDSDHSGLNKFWGEKDENFHLFLPELQEFVAYAAGRLHEKPNRTTENVHWIVPHSASSIFKGRERILEDIERILQGWLAEKSRAKQCRLVITGMGGQGKSEICLQVANRVQKRFWGIFWVDVSAFNIAETGFLAIAKKLKTPAETLEEARQALANIDQPWLLILDNADDPETNYQDYFPTGQHGTILMTSRVPACTTYATEKFDTLEGLEDIPARNLLLESSKIPPERHDESSHDAVVVVKLLGSHPLALIQAGAYLAGKHCTLQEYPQVYKLNRQRLLLFHPEQAKSRYGDVYATFEASAEVLGKTATAAAKGALEVLNVFSMLAPSQLPMKLFELAWVGVQHISMHEPEYEDITNLLPWHVSQLISPICAGSKEWDDFPMSQSIGLLLSFSLVTEDVVEDGRSFSMHPLVHSWTRDRQNRNQQVQSWFTTGSMVAFTADREFWVTRAQQLRSHIHALVSLRPPEVFRDPPEFMVAPILFGCGNQLYRMGDGAMLTELLDGLMGQMCLNPSIVREDCTSLYQLRACDLGVLGRTTESIPMLKQVVDIRKRVLDEDNKDLLTSQHELASKYRENGQVAEALSLIQHVVEVKERTLAEEHPSRLASQHGLALVYRENRQVVEALSLLQHVVEVQERTLAEEHPSRLASQHGLALTYQANGQVVEALSLLQHVVEVKERTLAEEHPSRLISQYELALTYQANGQVVEALSLLQHVVEVKERTLAEEHPSRLTSQHGLALTYRANGQVVEALSLLQYVVEVKERTPVEEHPDRLASQQILARTLWMDNQLDEAEELMEHVVSVSRRAFRPGHPRLLTCEEDLVWMRERHPAGSLESSGSSPVNSSADSGPQSSAQVGEVDTEH